MVNANWFQYACFYVNMDTVLAVHYFHHTFNKFEFGLIIELIILWLFA